MLCAQLSEEKNVHAKHFEVLEAILAQDALIEMPEQDKERVWRLRFECMHRYPEALPKLLGSVSWNNHVDVAQVRKYVRLALSCWLLTYMYMYVQ